jgi:EAL domain-containing protein (putative c-di-GMP-specific phosphodiesterase class I)
MAGVGVEGQLDAGQASARYDELRAAIGGGEIVLHYQPLVDAGTARVRGMEALARWKHPTRGLLPPAAFIPYAEGTDLIFALTGHVLREAVRQAAEWARGGVPLPVSVNISARSLARDDLVPAIASLLAEYRLPGVLLTVEVTESAVMTHPAAAAQRLTELRALGVRVSIDDFGTGYTSLALLTQLPIDELKVDRTFIGTMTESPTHAAIVQTIAELAGRLALTVVGEGVEDESTAGALRDLGFDLLQGYHFGRPSPADTVTRAAQDATPAHGGPPAPPGPSIPVPPAPFSAAPVRRAPVRRAPVPADEGERLAALARVLEAGPLPAAYLDDLVLLAAQLCSAPVAVFSLIHERHQQVIASHGVSMPDVPREVSFCAHAVAANALLEVADTRTDLRFAGNPIVVGGPRARYYAGAPVRTAAGQPLGVLCVFDSTARRMPPDQRAALESLARLAGAHLDLAQQNAGL